MVVSRSVAYQVGEESQTANITDSGLSRLRLLLAVHIDDERNVDERKVVWSDAELELTHRLDEWRRLDVTDCSSELCTTLAEVLTGQKARSVLKAAPRRCRRLAPPLFRRRGFWTRVQPSLGWHP